MRPLKSYLSKSEQRNLLLEKILLPAFVLVVSFIFIYLKKNELLEIINSSDSPFIKIIQILLDSLIELIVGLFLFLLYLFFESIPKNVKRAIYRKWQFDGKISLEFVPLKDYSTVFEYLEFMIDMKIYYFPPSFKKMILNLSDMEYKEKKELFQRLWRIYQIPSNLLIQKTRNSSILSDYEISRLFLEINSQEIDYIKKNWDDGEEFIEKFMEYKPDRDASLEL
jgi:hypothetical protein